MPSTAAHFDHDLAQLLANNRDWAAAVSREDPQFFARLAGQQAPKYLWIGCADSRVPANQITGLAPGEVFVHRNIANVVSHGDLNCLATIQFAVDLLKVEHILLVGHYGCSGVRACLDGTRVGLADNWLRHVGDVMHKHALLLDAVPGDAARHARLCELNVVEQVVNLCQTTVVQDAWQRRQSLTVHGLVYGLEDGLLRDLGMAVARADALPAAIERALDAIAHDRVGSV